MIGKEKKENKEFFKKSIEYLRDKGFTNIKADLSGHEKPKTFRAKKGDLRVTADITADKDGKKYFFDISLKSKKSKLLKSKWLLLDAVAGLKSDRFKIITTKGHLKFTDSLLSEVNLANKEPIKI
ncbi:MAG: hypothetical protein R2819_09540 [Allomuricauda sp.]